MRLENSARNLIVSWLGQVLYLLCSFVTRGVFAAQLSMDYMGLENLFANVLTLLSLAELGVGSAIIFSLYKPLAEDDRQKVRTLMRLFQRAYFAIGFSIALLGLAICPFIETIIKDAPDIPYLQVYFLCFVFNSAISYFFSYKGSLIIADQKKYKVALIQYVAQILMCLVQILVLLLTKNYLLFLACMIISTLVQNMVIAKTADRMYPYIKEKTGISPLDSETKSTIKKNMLGLILHKCAGVANIPTSSVILSNFVGLGAVAIFGSYSMITTALTRMIDQAFDAMTASAGHMRATEAKERQHEVFKTSFFINALLTALFSIPLLCVLDLFIGHLWLGTDYLFPPWITILIVVMFYLKSLRSAGIAFTSAYGLYWHTRWKAVIETVVMIVLSILLTLWLGIAGVILATIISTIGISITIEGFMLYKHGFERSSREYFKQFILYTLITAALGAVTFFACSFIPGNGVLSFLAKGGLSVVLTLAGFLLIFGRTPEAREFFTILRRLLQTIRARLSKQDSEGHS
jgi:O-antigen/teichoic acid export membrane protein